MVVASCTDNRATGPEGERVSKVCTAGVIGERIDPIREPTRGCGVSNPVRVHEVLGIRLSRPAIMDCAAARSLKSWVRSGVKPAFAAAGAEVTRLVVYDAYNCRNRNNSPTGKLSLHARGKAIDVGEFVLADGRKVTVLNGWRDRQWGPVLRRLHRAACGPFGTVLGPEYNRAHANHLHFDTDRYGRGGRFCR